jgi:hypothetical protein
VKHVDWPARFRAAAEVVGFESERAYADLLHVAYFLENARRDTVEAVERALLGEVEP